MTRLEDRNSSAIDRQRKAIKDLDVPALGPIIDKRRKQGSTHWDTWRFLSNIHPISRAEFDEVCMEWENDWP